MGILSLGHGRSSPSGEVAVQHSPLRARALLPLVLLVAVLVAALVVAGAVHTPATAKAAPIRIMTYNIRFASSSPPHAWSERLPLVVQRLRVDHPDLLGVQEAYW